MSALLSTLTLWRCTFWNGLETSMWWAFKLTSIFQSFSLHWFHCIVNWWFCTYSYWHIRYPMLCRPVISKYDVVAMYPKVYIHTGKRALRLTARNFLLDRSLKSWSRPNTARHAAWFVFSPRHSFFICEMWKVFSSIVTHDDSNIYYLV